MDDSRSQFEALLGQMPGPGSAGYKAFSEMEPVERKALFVLVKKDLRDPPFLEGFKEHSFFTGDGKRPSSLEEYVKRLDETYQAMGKLANVLADSQAMLHQAAEKEGLTPGEFRDNLFEGVYEEMGPEDGERARIFFDAWWPQPPAPGSQARTYCSGVPLRELVSLQETVSRVRKRRIEAQLVYAKQLAIERNVDLPVVVRLRDVPDEIERRIFSTPEMFEGYKSFQFQIGLMTGQMMYEFLEPTRRFMAQAGPALDAMFGDHKDSLFKIIDSIPPKTVMASYLRAGLNYERQEAARIFHLSKPAEIGVILL